MSQLPPPVVVVPAQSYPTYTRQHSRIYENTPVKSLLALGALQIVVGVLCFIFAGAAIGVSASLSAAGAGFWCAIFFFISGGLGIGAGYRKTKCLIVGCLVMSIISAIFAVILLSYSAAGLSNDNEYSVYVYYDSSPSMQMNAAQVAMNAILLILAIIELILAIWQSALCCRTVCCCRAADARSYPVTRNPLYTSTVIPPAPYVAVAPSQPILQYQLPSPYYPQNPGMIMTGQPQYAYYPPPQTASIYPSAFVTPPPYPMVSQTPAAWMAPAPPPVISSAPPSTSVATAGANVSM